MTAEYKEGHDYGAEATAEYEAFVAKFKPKKTTDDCMTPPKVYAVIEDYVRDTYALADDVPFVRPFYPGGDFEAFDYPAGCVVVDNPPFSILSKIVRFYWAAGIRFFLFAPTLTLLTIAPDVPAAKIVTGAGVVYENGASVATSFVTDLEDSVARVDVELTGRIRAVQKKKKKAKTGLPRGVVNGARLATWAKDGVSFTIPRGMAARISRLDNQQPGKGIFGGGLLLASSLAATAPPSSQTRPAGISYPSASSSSPTPSTSPRPSRTGQPPTLKKGYFNDEQRRDTAAD